jgi:hypothetical protein
LGAICHQIALNICNAAGIEQTCNKEEWITNDHFKKALQRYLSDSSDTLKTVFDQAIKQERSGKFQNTKLILKALTLSGEDGASHADLLKRIKLDAADYPSGNLTTYLRELQTPKRGSIIRLDSVSGKHYFSDPLYYAYAQCLFIPPKNNKVLEISLLGERFKMEDMLNHITATKIYFVGDVGWQHKSKRSETKPSDEVSSVSPEQSEKSSADNPET